MGAVNTVKDVVNLLTNPPIFITLVALVFFLVIGRRGFWRPKVGLVVGVVAAIFVALSTLDPNFRLIVAKPDNIPIVAMLFLVGFFFFLSMSQAYSNDERMARRELNLITNLTARADDEHTTEHHVHNGHGNGCCGGGNGQPHREDRIPLGVLANGCGS